MVIRRLATQTKRHENCNQINSRSISTCEWINIWRCAFKLAGTLLRGAENQEEKGSRASTRPHVYPLQSFLKFHWFLQQLCYCTETVYRLVSVKLNPVHTMPLAFEGLLLSQRVLESYVPLIITPTLILS